MSSILIRSIRMKPDFSISYHDLSTKLTLGSILFGLGLVSNDFFYLDLCNSNFILSSIRDCVCDVNG